LRHGEGAHGWCDSCVGGSMYGYMPYCLVIMMLLIEGSTEAHDAATSWHLLVVSHFRMR
jgi:hypothetical protein